MRTSVIRERSGGITPGPRHAHPHVNRWVWDRGRKVEIHRSASAIWTPYVVVVIYHATKMRWRVEAVSPEAALKEAIKREEKAKRTVKPILFRVFDPYWNMVLQEIGDGGRTA